MIAHSYYIKYKIFLLTKLYELIFGIMFVVIVVLFYRYFISDEMFSIYSDISARFSNPAQRKGLNDPFAGVEERVPKRVYPPWRYDIMRAEPNNFYSANHFSNTAYFIKCLQFYKLNYDCEVYNLGLWKREQLALRLIVWHLHDSALQLYDNDNTIYLHKIYPIWRQIITNFITTHHKVNPIMGLMINYAHIKREPAVMTSATCLIDSYELAEMLLNGSLDKFLPPGQFAGLIYRTALENCKGNFQMFYYYMQHGLGPAFDEILRLGFTNNEIQLTMLPLYDTFTLVEGVHPVYPNPYVKRQEWLMLLNMYIALRNFIGPDTWQMFYASGEEVIIFSFLLEQRYYGATLNRIDFELV